MVTQIGRPVDLAFSGVLSFRTTEVKITAETDAGRAFLAEIAGAGAVSVTVRKSAAERLIERAVEAGLREVIL